MEAMVTVDDAKLIEQATKEIRAGRSTYVPGTPEKYPGATVIVNLLAAEALADAVERLRAERDEWQRDYAKDVAAHYVAKNAAEADRDRLAAALRHHFAVNDDESATEEEVQQSHDELRAALAAVAEEVSEPGSSAAVADTDATPRDGDGPETVGERQGRQPGSLTSTAVAEESGE